MSPYKKIHFINFSRKLTINSVFFLISLYFLKLGFNGWQIGLILALYAFAPLLFAFPTGWINDRFAIGRIIQVALLAQGLLLVLAASVFNFPAMAAIFLCLGLANNALDVSTNSLFYKDETAMDQNRKYGLLSFWTALGTAAGTLIGGGVITLTSFPILLLAFGLYLLGAALLAGNFGGQKFEVVTFRDYRLGLLKRKAILFIILLFVLTLHWGVEGTIYSPFLRKNFGLSDLQVALYISLPLFMLALASFSIGRLKYDINLNRRLFLGAMFLSGAGLALMVNTNVYISFAFRVIHEIGDGIMGALIILFISRLFERKSIGGSSGILMSIMVLGHATGAMIYSPLGYRFGLQYPFIISGSLLLANVLFGTFIFKRENYG
jgi:MFS family permease